MPILKQSEYNSQCKCEKHWVIRQCSKHKSYCYKQCSHFSASVISGLLAPKKHKGVEKLKSVELSLCQEQPVSNFPLKMSGSLKSQS